MFGTNPKLPPADGDGQTLEVVKIFPTIQGEGPRAGQAAIFIRLGGCNLACKFCDTEFDNFNQLSIEEILQQVKSSRRGHNLIVITGGEPLRQNIVPLCESLIAEGFVVQIETNGTLFRELPKRVEIVCSPKLQTPMREDLLARITAFKFLVSANIEKYRAIPDIGQGSSDAPIYVQAIDEYDAEKNAANLKLAAQLVEEKNYILSVQIHKVLGIE